MAGRKKIVCELGEKRVYSFWLYPSEFQKLKIEYNKIKAQRKKYQTKLPNKVDIEKAKEKV